MPSSSQHTARATRNIKFLESFYSSHEFNDWTITVSFYISVHIIENAIALKGTVSYQGKQFSIEHSTELKNVLLKDSLHLPLPDNSLNVLTPHVARNLIVENNFQEIEYEYGSLYRNSRTARYSNYSWTDPQVDIFVRTNLKKIIEWSNRKFKTKFKSNL